jgi:tol-pal system protein YbgF
MRRPLALVIVMGAGILLASCATRSSVRQAHARLDALAKDIADIRETASRERSAETAELRALIGRLRETETRLRDTADRVATLGNRVAATETSLREVSTAVEALQRPTVAAVPARPARPGRAVDEPAAGAELAFASALKTFRSGEHGQAVLELTDFIGKYPTHPLAARAQIWIGDAYFKQRDYRQALLEYRKAVDAAAPGSRSAADAWLKVGRAYASLRERPAATAAWHRVMRQYPDTEAADQARSLLRK